MVEGLYVGEVVHHSLRATQNGSVYLLVQFRLQNGMGAEAKHYFTDKTVDATRAVLRRYGLPEDPRALDPRAGKEHVSFVGTKLLFQASEDEYRGKKSLKWVIASGSDHLATGEQIRAARKLAGID
jgi:phosphate-selective porin